MFKALIISQFNGVIKRTVEKYQLKYGADIELFLSKENDRLNIQVLANYSQKEIVTINDLSIPMVSADVVESKILTAIETLEVEHGISTVKIMLLVKNESVVSYLYDNDKPIKQIDISKII